MEFSRQEYWSGLPFLSLGDPPSPGIECESPALWLNSLPSEPPGKPIQYLYTTYKSFVETVDYAMTATFEGKAYTIT